VRFDRSHFQGYGDFALRFEIVYYVLAPNYNRCMDIPQAINLAIFETFQDRGIDFAYPTRTLHIAAGPGRGPRAGGRERQLRVRGPHAPFARPIGRKSVFATEKLPRRPHTGGDPRRLHSETLGQKNDLRQNNEGVILMSADASMDRLIKGEQPCQRTLVKLAFKKV
jgi:hypothetical protein